MARVAENLAAQSAKIKDSLFRITPSTQHRTIAVIRSLRAEEAYTVNLYHVDRTVARRGKHGGN